MSDESGPNVSRLQRLRGALAHSREGLRGRLVSLLGGGSQLSPPDLEQLERILIEADLGPAVADRLVNRVRRLPSPGRSAPVTQAMEVVRREIETILAVFSPPASAPESGGPRVVLVIGVNGTGKTTTIAKLAHRRIDGGERVLLAAADTFRAGAAEQLALWAERVRADIVRQRPGTDPAAVAFDAADAAVARGAGSLFVDTAGRLHTREDLRAELGKIARVLGKRIRGAPHEVFLVLDATTGQSALAQAELFRETVTISGIVVTKLDGTARAGIVVAIAERLGIPVRYVGVGEGMDDLQDFDPASFAAALMGIEEADV